MKPNCLCQGEPSTKKRSNVNAKSIDYCAYIGLASKNILANLLQQEEELRSNATEMEDKDDHELLDQEGDDDLIEDQLFFGPIDSQDVKTPAERIAEVKE